MTAAGRPVVVEYVGWSSWREAEVVFLPGDTKDSIPLWPSGQRDARDEDPDYWWPERPARRWREEVGWVMASLEVADGPWCERAAQDPSVVGIAEDAGCDAWFVVSTVVEALERTRVVELDDENLRTWRLEQEQEQDPLDQDVIPGFEDIT